MTAGIVVSTALPSALSESKGNKMEVKRTRIDVSLVERAVQALMQHLQRSKKEQRKESLFDEEERILLQFSLVKIPTPSGRTAGKPTLIRIPHSMWRAKGTTDGDINDKVEDADICIIVKDKATKANIKQMIPLFPSHLGNVKKIIPLESLRKKYTQFQQRRELLHQYTIFLADDRILPMVGSLLGKSFFQSKKQPIPVCVTRKGSFPFAVHNSITNTHLFLSSGTCVGLR
jgi:ribosome biogenesis protein UTP30